MSKPAVFLDRDGTINVEKEYLYKIEDWEWIPGAIEAIRRINKMGYWAIVITNQAGVARGYYKETDIRALHREVDGMLAAAGAKIDAYYYCPHHPDAGTTRQCQCRKPKPGLLFQAQKDFNIDMAASYMVGDKMIDMQAAQSAGVSPILVMTGYGQEERMKFGADIASEPDILCAVQRIEACYRNNFTTDSQ